MIAGSCRTKKNRMTTIARAHRNGRPAERIDTQLHVMIRPAPGANALWEGRARFTATANSRFADQRAAAGKLADALFDGFPGRSGETIEVR